MRTNFIQAHFSYRIWGFVVSAHSRKLIAGMLKFAQLRLLDESNLVSPAPFRFFREFLGSITFLSRSKFNWM
ncbi:MAG: hypothetical protein DWQ05_06385 [Calditrichaeota bacterium]|nr:MAG: hypothetical protein DWQ05_06385 [Calditrichota bacterium]